MSPGECYCHLVVDSLKIALILWCIAGVEGLMRVPGLLGWVKSGFQPELVRTLFLHLQRGIKRMEWRQMIYMKVDVGYLIPITRANSYAQHVFQVLERRLICVMLTPTGIASSNIIFVEILLKLSKFE